MFSVGSSSAVSSCFWRTNLRVLSLTKDVSMTWDFHIMRFWGLLAWELPEACNFSSLYSLAHSILSGSGLRVRWILKFVFSLVNWIFIHVTYICLSSAFMYLSHVVEHCFSSVFYVDKVKQSQSVFCFIIWVMDYAHRQAEEPVAKSERGPCLPLFCAQYIKIFEHGLQHWGLQRLIWSRFSIHFSECTTFSVTFKNSFEEHQSNGCHLFCSQNGQWHFSSPSLFCW